MYNCIMFKVSKKAFFKIKAIFIIAVLLISISLAAFLWHHSLELKDLVDPNLGIENPTLPEYEDPLPEPNESDNEPKIPTEPEEPEELDTPTEPKDPETPTEPVPPTEPENNTRPFGWSQIRIGGEDYYFDPMAVNTTRPDIFQHGQFSMFDILVYLDQQQEIRLDYHFAESMNSHIIDAINGETGWWYITYYSGGWPENNVFRPDHYPWKPGTQLIFHKENYSEISAIYSVWQQEVQRKESNNGRIIIPEVRIRGKSFIKEFKDVEVTPHNLRNDVFQEDVITAIDVILSLADQGKITYQLQWYDYIGSASIVRSYWVDAIDEDVSIGTCGFVYEAGSKNYRLGAGNHIHLPSDTRVLNSPEYVEFFWICLDPAPIDVPLIPAPNQ